MIITLAGFFVFIGLFLLAYGFSERKELFVAAGGIIGMIAGTAFVSEGLDFATGNIVTDFLNGTVITRQVLTNINNVWTIGLGRSLFYLSFLGFLGYMVHRMLQDKEI